MRSGRRRSSVCLGVGAVCMFVIACLGAPMPALAKTLMLDDQGTRISATRWMIVYGYLDRNARPTSKFWEWDKLRSNEKTGPLKGLTYFKTSSGRFKNVVIVVDENSIKKPQTWSGRWSMPERGIINVRQTGRMVTGSCSGRGNEHFGPKHRKGGTFHGYV